MLSFYRTSNNNKPVAIVYGIIISCILLFVFGVLCWNSFEQIGIISRKSADIKKLLSASIYNKYPRLQELETKISEADDDYETLCFGPLESPYLDLRREKMVLREVYSRSQDLINYRTVSYSFEFCPPSEILRYITVKNGTWCPSGDRIKC